MNGGISSRWPPEADRGLSNELKWQTLFKQRPRYPLVELVDQRERLTDAQKWEDLFAELGLDHPAFRNVGDVLYSLKTGWRP